MNTHFPKQIQYIKEKKISTKSQDFERYPFPFYSINFIDQNVCSCNGSILTAAIVEFCHFLTAANVTNQF